MGVGVVDHKNTKAEVKTNDTGSRCTENTAVSSGQHTCGDSVFTIKGAFLTNHGLRAVRFIFNLYTNKSLKWQKK